MAHNVPPHMDKVQVVTVQLAFSDTMTEDEIVDYVSSLLSGQLTYCDDRLLDWGYQQEADGTMAESPVVEVPIEHPYVENDFSNQVRKGAI